MTRIAHLSDLHFGFHREDLVEPLLERVNGSGADLVVVTGDLTHRGRPGQFRQAAEFLARLTAPHMAVPGNHDVPLYNIPVRFLRPYADYDEAISPDRAPTGAAGWARVHGINSVDPFAWQRGVVHEDDIGRVLGSLDALAVNIVALHHPLQQLPQVDKELARRAPEALARFEAGGVRIALTGHLHLWAVGSLLGLGHPHLLQVQAGTALCARLDDRQNEFAVLEIEGDDLRIERHVAPMDEAGFRAPELLDFTRGEGGWIELETDRGITP
ncbi:metallophosphoesterase family protein [Paracoccus zhejiangensis]|uniref:Metallophosphoesterase n=1 Tax=Paracoccus zhejiangensis TaxID=1077935 RepID=A0A2H5EYT1_9RHOB|nr:metallophosphoesterase [Paracoccus zhejiangensis]AUH64461.1 metallophosphoesterase [Paracoccus zhejiangensis]